jgi:hypothetical protein
MNRIWTLLDYANPILDNVDIGFAKVVPVDGIISALTGVCLIGEHMNIYTKRYDIVTISNSPHTK